MLAAWRRRRRRRSLALAPLRWLGLVSDIRTLRVPLFPGGFREKRDVPFALAEVAIKVDGWGRWVVGGSCRCRCHINSTTHHKR